MRMTLVRHGATDWNAAKRFQGHSDIPLNDQGLAQARTLARELANERFDAIISSDLTRCRQTAEIACAGHNEKIQFDARWREFHFGAWEGLTWEEIVARKLDDNDGIPHGRESAESLYERLCSAVAELQKRGYQNVLIITHFGPIGAVPLMIDPDNDVSSEPVDLGSITRLTL